jgi:DNA polymerase
MVSLWYGLLCENITQAVAADILRGALRELVLDHDAPVIGHTHDEIILETTDVDTTARLLRDVMLRVPSWAEGLPLGVKIGHGRRYGK